MATLYPAADGTILRALLSDADEATFPTPPPGAGAALAFDSDANAALIADLRASTDAYRLAGGGTLTKNGQPVAVAAAGSAYTDRQQLQAIRDALETYFALPSPTAAQSAAALKQTIRALRVVLQALNRRGLL